MKKRTRKERKEAFKKVYYAELQKQGVIERPTEPAAIEEPVEEKTKAELVKEAEALGLTVKSKMTKAQISDLIRKVGE